MQPARPRILFAALPCYAAARVLWQLCDMGCVPAVFVGETRDARSWRSDRRYRRLVPAWSVSAPLHRFRIPVEAVGDEAGWRSALARHRPDLLVSCYFPRRVPPLVLDALPDRCLNLHPALLPAYRGAMPQLAMALAGEGDRFGGMTLHLMAERFDAGAILAQRRVPLDADGDLLAWELNLARAAAGLIADSLPAFLAGEIDPRTQDETAARHVRAGDQVLSLRPGQPAEEALHVADVIGRSRLALTLRLGDRRIRLERPGRIEGPATGEPPRIGPFSVSYDALDARLRFRRRLPGRSWRRQLGTLRSLRRAVP